jgi:hypothetical protein
MAWIQGANENNNKYHGQHGEEAKGLALLGCKLQADDQVLVKTRCTIGNHVVWACQNPMFPFCVFLSRVEFTFNLVIVKP